MNIKSILFPTDFSESNDAALKYASALAAEAHDTLHIVFVQDYSRLSTVTGEAGFVYEEAWQKELEQAQERLKQILPTVPAVTYAHHCVTGSPVTEILAVAEDTEADLIVMASHGRTGLLRLLMGSIAEGVMRSAPCPVLIVRQPMKQGTLEKNPLTINQETRLLT